MRPIHVCCIVVISIILLYLQNDVVGLEPVDGLTKGIIKDGKIAGAVEADTVPVAGPIIAPKDEKKNKKKKNEDEDEEDEGGEKTNKKHSHKETTKKNKTKKGDAEGEGE